MAIEKLREREGRSAIVRRDTKETQIHLELNIDGSGRSEIDTPVPFLNHMLDAFARHGLYDLTVRAKGDIEIDAHHTVEDIGLCLGDAFHQALGQGRGLVRYGSMTLPMDDTLVTVAVDFGGRPAFVWNVEGLERRWVGTFDCELAKEFFAAFTMRAQANVHLTLHYGANAHHIIEALFKALARASDAATLIDPRRGGDVTSTKGTTTK